jgi:hypothetical protein
MFSRDGTSRRYGVLLSVAVVIITAVLVSRQTIKVSSARDDILIMEGPTHHRRTARSAPTDLLAKGR